MKKVLLNLLLLLMMSIGAVAQTTIFSEDFEGGTMPDGWTTDGPGAWSVGTGDYSTSTGAGEGTYNAKITHGSTDNVTKLITPEIDLSSAASAELSFMHIERSWAGDYDELRVYYRTSSSDSWTQLLEYTIVYATWTTEEGVVLPNLSGTYQLAFEMTDGYGYGVGIDFVKISTPPSCPKPSTLVANSITATTATIEWTSGSETNWVLKYGVAGFDVETAGTQETVESTPSFDLTGLTPNTEYDVYVKAVCSESEESDWRSTSFRTECEVLTVDADHPYTEGFESVTGSYAIPTCWERIVEYTSSSATYPYVATNSYYTTYSHAGDKALYMYTSSYNSAYENLIALPIMNGVNSLQISLWAKSNNSTLPEAFEIGYIKSGVFTSVKSITLSTSYQQYMAYLNEAPADAERIAIRAYHSSSSIAVFVDDIEVSEMPTCIAPENLHVSNITTNSASVVWTDILPATAWQYQLNDGDIENVDAKPINLTELTPNTEYTIKVRTVCGDSEFSDWTEGSFTTLCNAITIDAENPYTEDFESYTGTTYDVNGVAPDCWKTTSTGSVAPHIIGTGSYYYVHGGDNALTFYGTGYCYAVLPTFTNDLTTLCVEFWSRMESTYYGTLVLGYITADDDNMNTFTEIETYTSSSVMTSHRTLLGTVPAEATRLVFRWYYSGQYSCCIDDVVVRLASTEAEILTYSLPTQVSEATIGDGTIEVTVANSTDFDVDLTPTYTISENAEISDPVVTGEGDVRTIAYTVTAEAGNTKDWTVTVTKAPISHDAFITAFTFAGQNEGSTAEIVSENDTYTVDAVAEWNADLTTIAPTVTISAGAQVTPASGAEQDFTAPVTYTVLAEDGETSHTYTVTIVNDPDACINPATVSISNITNNSATASWAQAYTETSYLVKVSSEALDMDNMSTADVFDGTVDATTKDIEGLTANTQYFVYVQSNCDNAEGWTSTTFHTLCNAITEFPWTENFESYNYEGSFNDPCWTNEHISGSGSSIFSITTYGNENNNTHQLYLPDMYSGTMTKLVLPEMNFGEVETAYAFSIDVYRSNSTYNNNNIYEGVRVFASTDGNIEGATEIAFIPRQYNTSNAVIPEEAQTGWYTYTLNIPITTGTCYLILRGESQYCTATYMDNFVVRELSHEAEILTYSLPTQVEEATITSGDDAGTIDVTVFNSTDFETLVPSYTISEYATINDPVITGEGDARIYTYTVTAEAGNTKVWTVNITKAPVSTDAFITAFTFAGQKEGTTAEIVSDAETSTYTVNAVADWYIDLSYIVPTVTVSPAATVVPESGVAQDFTADDAVTYTVTAEDGETSHTYTVTIVNDPDACVNPDFVSISNITANAATIAWEQAYTETSYRVKVSTTAMSNMTATANVFDETVDEITVTLEGLTANTLYYVYVQSNCDNAEGWTITSFKTSCEPIAELPYEEGFEGAYYAIPDCWTKVGDGYATGNDYYVNSGSYAMMFYGVAGGNIIALPQFEENISSLALDFYTMPESHTNTYSGTFEVGYITDLNDASSFVPVESYSYDDWTSYNFERKIVRMTSAPEGSYFAFNHKANSSSWYWFVDDVVVREFNTEAEIVDFNFPTRMSAPVINSEAGTVTTTASYQADLENLDEIVTVSDGAEYVAGATSIEGNVKTFAYTVTAEDGTTTKDWTVTVTKAESASTATDIIAFSFDDQSGESIIDTENHTVTAYAEWYVSLEYSDITPTIEVSPMATISNDGEARNFFGSDETPVQYTVTAEDGTTTQLWNVTIVNDPNACVNPSYVYVYDVTENSATLNWGKMYLETSYLVKVSTTPMEDMSAQADVYDNVVTLAENEDEITLPLTDLSAATAYYVYVQSNCDAEDWTETYFATECDGSAFSVPFVETFDATSGSKDCWNIVDANNDDYTWHFTQEYAYQQEVAGYSYNSYNDANDWLISPKISIIDGAALTFDYWTYPYYTEKFSVYVITDLENYATTATQILPTQTILGDNTYTGAIPPAIYSLENIDLSAYAGQEIYIGIKCESEADQDVLYIDNFKVALPVYTITATAGENGTIDPESAEVTYGTDKMFTITPAEGYRIATVVVDAETDVTENVVAGDEAFFYTFTNVTANHTIHATFEEIPTYTITVEAGEHGTVLYNDALVSTSITVAEGDTPEFVITPDTNYQIDVLTIDGEAVELTQVQLGGLTYTFEPVTANHTLSVTFAVIISAEMLEAGSMAIYPNPNNGMFSIDFSNIEGDATYQLINANGAVVETRDINVMSGETMNFSHDLRPGTYFVRIINGDKVYVEQIVVE